MTFKLSPRVLVFSAGLCLLVTAAVAGAQTPTPAPSPAHKAPGGFLRLLNLASNSDVTYQLNVGVDAATKPVLMATPGNFFAGYEHLAPGHYTLRITKAGAGDQPFKTVDAAIVDKGYFSVLVSPDASGQPVVELVDETPDPKKASNRLMVRQLYGNARAVVTAGGQRTNPLDYGQSQLLEGMPDGRITVLARITTSHGAHNWSSEADFSLSRRASAYVVADPYGRIRLRYTADGPDPKTEQENRDAANPPAQ